MAIRASIGASRGQLMSQLLVEAAVLAALGLVISIPVAMLTLGVVVSILPSQLATTLAISIDGNAIQFAIALTLFAVFLASLFPVIQATRTDPGTVLKGQSSQSPGGRGVARFRASLATAQIAFSMVLLVLAGLFTQSLLNVSRIDIGMHADSLLTFTVSPRLNGYSPERVMQVYGNIEDELAAQPGVIGVSSSMVGLLTNSSWGNSLRVEGFDDGPGVDTNSRTNEVGTGFLATLGIPLLLGREFTEADTLGTPRVAIVNESFVEKFALGDQAIGKRLGVGGGDGTEMDVEIVGVMADAKYEAVKGDVPPVYLLPRRQNDNIGTMNFYVRTALPPDEILAVIPLVIAGIDPDLPISNLTTMARGVEDNVFMDRMVSILSAGFASLATLLAAIGLYGVLAYNVTQRTREIGLRMALGAAPARLRSMVMKQVGLMAVIGGVVGLGAAVGLGRIAEALLFGLTGYDPVVLMIAVVVLTAVVLVAGYLPARRASRVTPMEALRYE
jgi:predicted permease